ncbi:M48 family metallopeptidase [Uliginosibacterium sp. H3]|uniref:M48 family metallopeptidase n=1 Tax=Uliginosibacterium silvisoli TaxID=3114758 RepID=A0ABU6JY09_9RHOO|nr:M48 family metallopeptidase [Uliginosibacterium sp. H3]
MVSEPVTEGIRGRYFDGRSTRPLNVIVSLDAASLLISGECDARWTSDSVSISERLGRTQRKILLPDAGFIEVPDSPLWDALPQQWGRSGLHLAWLEAHWRHVLTCLVGIVVACAVFYVYALPWVATRVAEQIPVAWVSQLSQGTLDLLDRLYVAPSKLPAARQKQLAEAFAQWAPPDAAALPYRLHFRNGVGIGPNAFAMPSGDIVITDQLVALAKDDKEILGVLAHELGHLQKRHAIRQLMQSAMLAVAANVFLGDMGDVTGSAAALMNLRYSRDFEREADDYAIRMMRLNHTDPNRLAAMLERLDPEGAKAGADESSYFATHPITAERIKRLQERALGEGGLD